MAFHFSTFLCVGVGRMALFLAMCDEICFSEIHLEFQIEQICFSFQQGNKKS